MSNIAQVVGFKKPEGFGSVIKTGLIAGGSAGAISAIITMLTRSPFAGQVGGSILAAAMQKDEVSRKVIAINGFQDGIFSLLTLGR